MRGILFQNFIDINGYDPSESSIYGSLKKYNHSVGQIFKHVCAVTYDWNIVHFDVKQKKNCNASSGVEGPVSCFWNWESTTA